MGRILHILFTLVTVLAGAGSAHAQSDLASLAPGARVRVSILRRAPADSTAEPDSRSHLGLGSGDRIVGRWLALRGDAIALRADHGRNAEMEILLSRIAQLEVSNRRRSRAGRGARIGLVAGAIGGYVTGRVVGRGENFGETGGDPKAVFGVGLGIGGALVGAGLGALIGGRFHTDDWRTVRIR
jgi:hypothetical protein